MSAEQTALLIASVCVLIILTACFFGIRKALRTGEIRYGGNRNTTVRQTYKRSEQPFMFWAGIGVIIFVALVAIGGATMFVLGVYGIEI